MFVVAASLFLMIGYVFHVIASGALPRQQLQATTEFRTKLLERVGTMKEFGEFLNTDGGKQLLGALATAPAGGAPQIVVDYMTRLAGATPLESARLPGADVLWVKAQMLLRWDAERKAQAPLDLMEPVQVVAGLAAALVLLVWSFPSLLRALSILGG